MVVRKPLMSSCTWLSLWLSMSWSRAPYCHHANRRCVSPRMLYPWYSHWYAHYCRALLVSVVSASPCSHLSRESLTGLRYCVLRTLQTAILLWTLLNLVVRFSYLTIYSPAVLRALLVLPTSRHSEYFLRCIIYWIDGNLKDFICVFASVRILSSVIVHFNDADRKYFWL